MSEVTLVVTSCGRPDLLKRTLESFQKFNTYPVAQTIIVEDGPFVTPPVPAELFRDLIYLTNNERRGQIACIDRAYSHVKTPYIFHCEDDWEFYRPGFVEASMEILKTDSKVLQVWLRERNDTNGHPIFDRPGLPFDIVQPGYLGAYHGFSFNPGLRRLCDYQRIGSYSALTPSIPGKDWNGEALIGLKYFQLGFLAAITPQGYVRHIGWNRTVS